MKKIEKIPATKKPKEEFPVNTKKKAAAYVRVSTMHEEQQHSLESQTNYYEKYIKRNKDWIYTGIYADNGISGGSLKSRKEFQRMISDCIAGKIDLIITKSISRFARNTMDTLSVLKQLKKLDIGVYFEKENIWSLDANGEFLISILASYSQEESRSISENTKWGIRKRFAQGEYRMPYAYFLGYDKGMEINKEQAILVRKIYRMYLQGYSCHKIKKSFEENDIPTVSGKNHWYNTVIKSILQNEKYKGDALLQKTYIADFTTHLKVKNTGELPQYYITADHEAIISPFVFDLVQDKYKRRINMFTSGKSPLSGKILCGCCGQFYGPYVWHSTSSRSKRVWKCPSFRKDIPNCNNTFINETALFESVLKVWKHFLRTDKYAVKLCELILEKNINFNSYIRKADILDFDDFLLLLDRIIIKDNLLTFIFIDNSTYKVKFQNIKRYKRK